MITRTAFTVFAMLGVSRLAEAAPFVLTPPAGCSDFCGTSRLTQQKLRPLAPILSETQYAEFKLSAKELLRDSSEHIAVSLMASDVPFKVNGELNAPNAPGGGLGIALGAISSQVHPACPADPTNAKVELAIERFGANDSFASTLVKCVAFDKSLLNTIPTFKVTLSVDCSPTGSCYTAVALKNAQSNAIVANVVASSLTLGNPTRLRKIWYAVTDFNQADSKRYSAAFDVVSEIYHAELKDGPVP